MWFSHKINPQVLLISEQEGKKKYEITCLPNRKDGGEKIKFMPMRLNKNSQIYGEGVCAEKGIRILRSKK